jgi:hypothetical protein
MLTAMQFLANVVDSGTILVQVSDLQNNFLDLKDMDLLPTWNSELYILVHVHSLLTRNRSNY